MVVAALTPTGLAAPLQAVLSVLVYFFCLKLVGGGSLPEVRSLLGMLRNRH